MEINQLFGRYLVIKSLGSGATSEVYLAHDTILERDVALKVLKPALVSDPVSFGRFTVEAQAASKLFHHYIATVLDMGDKDGHYYIAMRYIEGMSLDAYLRKNGPLPWESVQKLARQIGSALSHAHAQGYLHRDIKPNNIMVSSKGDFVLTDFGLTRAMFASGMTSTTGAILGTPAYIPPEIWNGKPASPLSDQYSFACVIDEAITGYPLFSGETPQEIITKHLVTKPEIPAYPAGMPENIRYIIQKALSKNSAERFPDIQAFVLTLLDSTSFDVAGYLKQMNSQEQSDADKKRLENLNAKKRRKTITSIIGIVTVFIILSCVIGFFAFKDRLLPIGLPPTATASLPTQAGAQPASSSPVVPATQIPTAVPTQTASTTLISTPTTIPTPTSTDTPEPTDTLEPSPTPGPFSDNFDNGLNPVWDVMNGDWITSNGKLTLSSGNNYWGWIDLSGYQPNNLIVKFDVMKIGNIQVSVRKQGANLIGYALDVWGHSCLAYLQDNYFGKCVGDGAPNISGSPNIRIEANGNNYSLYVNGEENQRLSVSGQATGYISIGIACGSDCPQLDNFSVEPLP